MSARNYAEMKTRYEANLADVKELKEKQVKLVWTSSHADASPRCQPYQGKLYSLDGTSGKTEDGISYTPLDKALQGPKGDGNGIINGYNCRHYLIEYKPGSKAPIDYDKATVMRENQINNKQRNFESNIRQLKLQERLARKSGDKELATRLNNRWKILELEYQKFSLENDRAYFPWRTAIIRNEMVQRTKWGDKQVKEEISVMTPEYDKFDDDGNIIFDTFEGTQVIIDREVLNELSHSKHEFKIGNDIYKYRERDRVGLTGIEHIASKKHNFKTQDISYIEKCLKTQEQVFRDRKNIHKRCVYLSGTFGINNDMPYLKVVVDTRSKDIITSYPSRNIAEDEKYRLNEI